jgi:hypothetical protein
MTATNDTQPTVQTPIHPADMLLHLIITLLAPMFLCISGGNLVLARLAALETINGYRAHRHADLIIVAQIVAFGLAAIGTISQSMADDVPLPLALRLRANAVACNRAAEQNRIVLERHQASETPVRSAPEPGFAPEYDPCSAETDPLMPDAAEQLLAAESQARLAPAGEPASVPAPPDTELAELPTDKRQQQMWAIAMVKEASEITASLPYLPPEDREAAALRAGNLGRTAHDLIYSPNPPRIDPNAIACSETQAPPPP